MSKLFFWVCYANVPPLSCTPPPQPWLFWCISSLVSSLSHGQQGEEFLVLEAQWQPLPPLSSLSYPLLGTVFELIWSLVGLNNSEEVSRVASTLQIFQRRGKVRHWLVFTVWSGRSWDLNPGVIKLWIALPLTSPHCSMFLSRIDHTWLWRCWRIKSHHSRRVLWMCGLPLYL